jgi:hypothetical protein
MFDDIIDAKIPVHSEIERRAVEWAEYELNRIYGNKYSLYVPSLQGEAVRMLTDRLGKNWRKYHKIDITVSSGKDGYRYDIKIKISKR